MICRPNKGEGMGSYIKLTVAVRFFLQDSLPYTIFVVEVILLCTVHVQDALPYNIYSLGDVLYCHIFTRPGLAWVFLQTAPYR